MKALVEKGLLKVQNFKSSKQKADLTRRFLIRTTKEYELLKTEIELLKQEESSSS